MRITHGAHKHIQIHKEAARNAAPPGLPHMGARISAPTNSAAAKMPLHVHQNGRTNG